MADINSTVAAPFIPEIWANRALEILRNNIVVAPLVTKDSDLAVFNEGQTLSVPYPGTFTANTKTEGSAVTLQTPTGSSATVTLNKHKESSFLIEDYARAIALPYTMDAYLNGPIVALAEQVETDLIALYATFSGQYGTAGTSLAAADLRAINKRFTDNKVARGNRHVVISTKDTAAILADANLQSFLAFNASRGDITNGLISDNLFGLQVHESQLIPTTGSAPVATHNLAFDPGAIILASRALPEAPVGSGVHQAVVQDPMSGLNIRISMSYSANNLGVQVTADVLYGVAILRDAKGFSYAS
jgi:hypothetical protein